MFGFARLIGNKLFSKTDSARRKPARRRYGRPQTVRLEVERLDERIVPATILKTVGAYAFADNNVIYQYQWTPYGGGWLSISGNNILDFGATSGGQVYAFANDNVIYQYRGANSWSPISGNNMLKLGVSSSTVYALANDNYVYQYTGTPYYWSPIGGNARDFGVSYAGQVYGLGYDSCIYQYTGTPYYWSSISGAGMRDFGVTAAGQVYALSSAGWLAPNNQNVFQYSGSPNNWSSLNMWYTNVLQLVVGCDGNPYMVASTGGGAGVFKYSGSGFDWGASLTGASLQNALATWQVGLTHPAASATYSQVNGTLFAYNPVLGLYNTSPTYLDVQQGSLGDCWLIASLAEVAYRAPTDITNMFIYDGTTSENGSTVGVYSVRLYNSSGEAKYFTVDTMLPGGASGPYDRPVGGGAAVNGSITSVLWAALVEKAYAQANAIGWVTSSIEYSHSYDALNSGWMWWALPAITGKPATSNVGDITTAWNNGQLITLSTNNSQAGYIVNDPNTGNAENIIGNHAYAVVGFDSASQKVTMFNPWGGGASYSFVTATEAQLNGIVVAEGIGNGAAPGGGEDRRARIAQDRADLAFIDGVLDAHPKTPSTSGSQVFCAHPVTGNGRQLAPAFSGDTLGSSAASGEGKVHGARSSHDLVDFVFVEDLLDSHSQTRPSSDVFLPDYARL